MMIYHLLLKKIKSKFYNISTYNKVDIFVLCKLKNMIETIEFKGKQYPKFQSTGFSARFAFPFAKEVCKGFGYDIGCNREEWKFEGAIGIDPNLKGCEFDAYNLPPIQPDYIFSSHCLEHLRNWSEALTYWRRSLKSGGVLFLYLPHPNQKYWKSLYNTKHIHNLSPELLRKYFEDTEWKNIFVSSNDLNDSFYVIAEKP